MSHVLCTYFQSKKYQEISKIIQFTVYENSDSKKFADMKMKYDLDFTHKSLLDLLDNSKDENSATRKSKLMSFVKDYFIEEDDLLSIPFLEVVSVPPFVDNLSEHIKNVYIAIHNLWYTYARRDDNSYQIDRKTGNRLVTNKIYLPYLYFVTGGRFREAYYWDSHWILIGLLSSNMEDYAFELVKSISFLIETYGYVPNGTRQYYLGRSQPPFFAQMLLRLYKNNVQREWVLNEGLEALEKEYSWWMTNRHFDNGLRLNRYRVIEFNIPRPESFKEDFDLKDKYRDLWGGAESGWDFSSRWNDDKGEICTGDIIPVDLNVYLLAAESVIVLLNEYKLKTLKEQGRLEDDIKSKIEKFKAYKKERESHINEILWNKDLGVWNDYNTVTRSHDESFYFSNITPLFANIKIPVGNIYTILYLYRKELFGYPGGIPASNVEGSTQQWDFPNVWAPLVQMFTEYLLDKEYNLSLHVAKSFFRSVYKGMGSNKEFHEKYNCLMVGEKGKGGEYEPQEGFGWTNGTVAWMIKKFKNELVLEDDHEESYKKIVKFIKDKREVDTNNN